MTIVSIGFGIMIGYPLGHKNDRTLKQQISKLKDTVKSQNKSTQLKELTTEELKQRNDWDFRSKLAEITGNDITNPDAKGNDDPASMENTF